MELMVQQKKHKSSLVNIRIDKTVPTGTPVLRRLCNENCNFDSRLNIKCHEDNSYRAVFGQNAIGNEGFVGIVSRIAAVSRRRTSIHIAGDGEPTLFEEELLDLVSRLKALSDVESIKITTNGTRLSGGQPTLAARLKSASVDGLNISIHSLTREGFREVTHIDALHLALAGLDAAVNAGLYVSVNCVVRDQTFEEVDNYIKLSIEKGVKIKFFCMLSENQEAQEYAYSLVDRLDKVLTQKADSIGHYVLPYAGKIFKIGKAIVELKDTRINSCPNTKCVVRTRCTEGCRYHVRITPTGVIQPCGIRTDNLVKFTTEVTDGEIFNALRSGGKV